MINTSLKFSLLILLIFFSVLLKAAPANSNGYETLSQIQPTQDPDKIEVIEFFWYGCPHCLSFEPDLENWRKNLPENVQFIRQPAIFSSLWGKHAKAYFTADALGVIDKMHANFFNAIQNQKTKLETEDQLAKFFTAHGVDETEFRNAYNSFLVDAKMRQAKTMSPRYSITGVPAIIINGKYKITSRLAGSHKKMIEVMNHLIKKESNQ